MFVAIILITTLGSDGRAIDTSITSVGPFATHESCANVAARFKQAVGNTRREAECFKLGQ